MTEFKITKKATGRDFLLQVSDSKNIHATVDGKSAEITISYADIVRMKLACEDARVRYQG
jgi:hypothetical protein